GLAEHRVGEGEALPIGEDQRHALQIGHEGRGGAGPAAGADRPPLLVEHPIAEGGGELLRPGLRGSVPGEQAVGPRRPDGVQIGGELGERALGHREAVGAPHQHPALEPVAHELHREQGVPTGALGELCAELTGDADQRLDQVTVGPGLQR
ncbi:MAG: hypothetical protein ACK559_22235, partial [bacterium]